MSRNGLGFHSEIGICHKLRVQNSFFQCTSPWSHALSLSLCLCCVSEPFSFLPVIPIPALAAASKIHSPHFAFAMMEKNVPNGCFNYSAYGFFSYRNAQMHTFISRNVEISVAVIWLD